MSVPPHRISDGAFRALAGGGGGAAALGELRAAQFSKHLMLVRAVTEMFPQAAEAYAVLADLETAAAPVVGAILHHPAVGAWAAATLRGAGDPDRLSAVALAAALRAGVKCELPVPSSDGWITLPSAGGFPARGLVIVGVGPDGVTADGHPVSGWRALPTLSTGDFTVTVDDMDPHRWPAGIELPRLHDRRLWESRLGEAWRLLGDHHWTVREEVASVVTVLTPIGAPAEIPQSESSREAFGAIALSTPASGLTLAETFAHETQHVKLYALIDVVPLLALDSGDFYYAPWRPDPRPARGLLNGTYAYLGVTGFWRRQRLAEPTEHADYEFAQWREAAYDATQTLLAGRGLTAKGVEFTRLMAETLRPWLDESVGADALSRARRAQDERRAAWERRNKRSSRSAEGRSRS
ncbi:aKG-HExxH-type peptide beta-hydroxylase [Herbidospora mongoliensis]|uniref:aKG-HExxH-type peptide beta-hydroxylase n=1 Tax=Herbidospora mongoliensis TaxID=688067 RepID=UPI000829F2E8|nr:HEXXH motif-containing putative peptide modification protein [Herbidospora mongoliensis]